MSFKSFENHLYFNSKRFDENRNKMLLHSLRIIIIAAIFMPRIIITLSSERQLKSGILIALFG
jgi:hypothetical protein